MCNKIEELRKILEKVRSCYAFLDDGEYIDDFPEWLDQKICEIFKEDLHTVSIIKEIKNAKV